MNKFYIFVFCILVGSIAKGQAFAQKSSPHVLAEINGQIISSADVDKFIEKELNFAIRALNEEEQHALKKEVLEKKIERYLILKAAKKFSSTKFRRSIPKEISLKEKEDLLISNYLNKVVYSKIDLSEDELQLSFVNAVETLRTPLEAKLRQIFIPLEKDIEEQALQERLEEAENILSKANGEKVDFETLSKKRSKGIAKSTGGNLGFITENQLDPAISEVVFNLNEGEVSPVLRSEFGLHIFKVEKLRGGKAPEFEEVIGELRRETLNRKKRELEQAHLQELRNKSKVIVYIN